jgi:ribonuclease HI
MTKTKFYGVRKGFVPGVYTTWDECKSQVDGFSGAEYKSFKTEGEARNYIGVEKCDETIDENAQALIDAGIVFTSDGGVVTLEEFERPYAFVDGSFNSETGVYGYGGYLFDGEKKYPLQGHDDKPDMASMRNVAGEIEGSMVAVRKAEELGIREMTMFYDYQGIEKWATGEWKTNTEGTKAYAEFMKPANRSVLLTFTHTKGHSGIEGNEIADVMAKNSVGIALTPKQKQLYDSVFDTAFENKRIRSNGERRLPDVAISSCDEDIEFC